jgi:NAD(P)-dependent dehydrogenase (short-subunit alcohol dehydrogenase family)
MALSVVTGASRGIGLALAAALRRRGAEVLATCRRSTPALDELGVEVVAGVDVREDAGAQRLLAAVGERSLDLLINNAGILHWKDSLESPDFDSLREQFEVNALGPLRVTSALLPRLQRGAKVALITSRMGSIGDNGSGGFYGYRMSKAALNMAGVSMARDLRPRGVSVAVLHPGMVKTDMVGDHGEVEPEAAAARLLERIDGLTLETTGTFWHANGSVLPW